MFVKIRTEFGWTLVNVEVIGYIEGTEDKKCTVHLTCGSTFDTTDSANVVMKRVIEASGSSDDEE